jgi:hypothetical protein
MCLNNNSNKIFVDFNNADTKGRIRLNTAGTLEDLKKYHITLVEGLEVILDDNDGLVTKGIVKYSEEENIWVAIINSGFPR